MLDDYFVTEWGSSSRVSEQPISLCRLHALCVQALRPKVASPGSVLAMPVVLNIPASPWHSQSVLCGEFIKDRCDEPFPFALSLLDCLSMFLCLSDTMLCLYRCFVF